MVGLLYGGGVVGEEACDANVGVADADQEEVRAVGGLDVVTPEVEGDVAGCGGADGFGVGFDVVGGVLEDVLVLCDKQAVEIDDLHQDLSSASGC